MFTCSLGSLDKLDESLPVLLYDTKMEIIVRWFVPFMWCPSHDLRAGNGRVFVFLP